MFMDRSDVYGECAHLNGMPVLLLFSYLIIPHREQVLAVCPRDRNVIVAQGGDGKNMQIAHYYSVWIFYNGIR